MSSTTLPVVRLDVLRLLDALHRVLWRHGQVKPENLRHRVAGTGDHRIALTIAKDDAVYKPPVGVTRPGLSASAWASPDAPPLKKKGC
jgi:hypothetical protein